jgi:2-polyprenyl-3-methyl-5-hydroxy-6-metoxy-1,4-benzoquinol methylase
MFAEAQLKGTLGREAQLYETFLREFPEEVDVHTPTTFRNLVDSMACHGFDAMKPVQANPDEFTLVNGAHRCAAAIQLGYRSIPYIVRFTDDRVDDEVFERTFTEPDLALVEAKREEYIAKCEPLLELQCRLRLHMRRHTESFQTAFSSPTRTPSLRMYQGLGDLGIEGKRPAGMRASVYGLPRHLNKSMRVLEAGCNVGFLTLKMAEYAGSVQAFDVDPHLISVAERVRDFRGADNCEFLVRGVGDFRSDEAFDFVVSTALHGWVGMPFDRYARLVWDWTKPGGLVLFESHEIDAEENWPEKKALLLANFQLVESGLIDDVDHSMYESEMREFLILRKPDDCGPGGLQFHSLEWGNDLNGGRPATGSNRRTGLARLRRAFSKRFAGLARQRGEPSGRANAFPT